MKRSLLLCISFIVFLTAPLLHAAEAAAEPSGHGTARQEILILNSYHPGYSWSDDEQAGIIDVFQGKDKNWLPVIEYLDLKRLPDGRHLAELKKLFRRKYQNKKFSVVIAMDNRALEFAMDNQAELFGNAPIVFCGINNYEPSMLKGRTNVTGIVQAIDIAGTIEVMLRLHPATKEIFSPHDYTATGLAVRKELEALVSRFEPNVRFRFTDPLTMDELLKELERLPKESIVLALSFITDKSGRTFAISETTELFFEHSPVPIYSPFEQRLGFGIVGGKLLSARIHGTNAARIALRVLAGEKASAIPVVLESDSQFMFDYKVMSRFGIPLSALPENSTVINKPVSFYAVHRVVIQTALGIIVFLAVVISLLTINITQRRRSAIALRASEAKYYDLYENAPDMYFSVDVKTATITEGNNTLVEAFGYAKEEMLGRSIYEMYRQDCREDVKRLFQQFTATGEVCDAELKIMCKDGSIMDVSLNASAVRDKDGKITHSRSIWRDITNSKRAEEALKESESKYRNLIDQAWDAIFVIDSTGKMLLVNEQACQMLGYTQEELIRLNIADTYPVEERAIAAQRIATVQRGDYLRYERSIVRKDGTIFPVEVAIGMLPDGMIQGIVRNITERKQAEEALRRAEENFRRSLDDSPLGVRIATAEGETIYANRAILDIYSIEELNTTSLMKRYTPESYAEFQIRREKRKRGDYGPSEYEVSIVKKDGQIRYLKVFRKEVLWNGERQFQVIYQDITERRRVENEIQAVARFPSENPNPVLRIARDGTLLYVNAAGLSQLSDRDLKVGQGVPSKMRDVVSEALNSGKVRLLDIEHYGRVYSFFVAPIADAGYANLYGRDITERKKTEKALRTSREQLRALAGRLQAVREEERTQIAREIHDELGGALTGLKIDLSLLTRAALKIEDEIVRTSLLAGMNSMTKFIDATIHTVRRIAMELRPGVLDDLGLVAALEWQLKDFEKRTGIRCEFFPPVEDISLEADLSTALFRIFQEAMTNVVRHSGATEVRVHLRADADSSTLEVEDNGKGIEKEKTLSSKSLGLLGMRERAQMFGGRITMMGTPGIGTKVAVEILPVEKRKMDRDQGEDAG